jgi:WD40 repeat protein
LRWRNANEIFVALDTADQLQTYTVSSGTPGPIFTGRTPSAYSPDGSKLATADQNRTVRIINAQTGATLQTLYASSAANSDSAFGSRVMRLTWNPTGTRIAVVAGVSVQVFGLDGVRIWETNTPQLYPGPLLWNANGRIASGYPNGGSLILDDQTGQVLADLNRAPGVNETSLLASQPNGRLWLAIQNDKLVLLSGSSLRTVTTISTYWKMNARMRADWSADGTRFAVTDGESRYAVYKVN